MKVQVIRAFLLRGERQEPGSALDLADEFAREMIALGKVGPVDAKVVAPSGPMTTDNAAPMVAGKSRGARHAGKSSAG